MSYFQESFDLKVKERVAAVYGKTLETLQDDVDNIQGWLKTQPHLPQVLTDKQIETYVILCKGNIEKAKSKIDMYFTMRTRFPEIFLDYHPLSDRIKQAQKQICFVPLPRLCDDLGRVMVIKVKSMDNPAELDPYACFALLMNVVDVRILEDICSSHTILFDLEHVKVAHAMKMTPMFVKTIFFIGEKALTTRVSSLHLVNTPSFVDQTLLIVKSVIKPKLAQKIIVHRDAESAVKNMDKNILPSEYGGYEKSLNELEEMFLRRFDDRKDFFDERENWKVDEDLRPEKLKDDGFFGCYGNFKKLQVD